MTVLVWCLAFIIIIGTLAYQRAAIKIWSLSLFLFFALNILLNDATIFNVIIALIFLSIFIPLTFVKLRRRLISQRLLNFYRTVMPTMSRTEREAIAAGTVTWEGDLFSGNPDWHKLFNLPAARLTAEEQAFLDGPTDTLCQMLDDWDITQNRADLPLAVWEYLKKEGFFALIIPKQYGGKGFSAYAHSQILIKISSRSITASSTVAVPNSLGPAELLLHYGTDEQKNYYLPRLARGEEIPCFALTSPEAGSDAGAMTDHGIVCYGEYEGTKTLGIRLNWNKRYITLAPVATVIGLAFKMYDPDKLLGGKEDIGITCALIPRHTPGLTIGRRHFPLNVPFQNGPIQGKDVFIPLKWIIGGENMAGKGWRMLMECLAAGRAISLPASALGGAKVLSYTSGAYARIRKQFNQPIGRFEGIEEPLARIGAFTYLMDAARTFAAATIDAGEKPAVASAIVKYHVTELGRQAMLDGMDIHGGKGICLGPKNYLGRGYEGAPIAITVEGANILTRNMIIFGQGALRCHPYVLAELEAAKLTDPAASLAAFDKAVIKHLAFGVSNLVRSFVLGITNARIVNVPRGKMRHFYQQATRFSSAFAFMSDVSMAFLGSALKRKESLSARLGDILSYLYLLSAVLKHYKDQGENIDDLPLVRYAGLYCLYQIQDRFDELFRNFPNRFVAGLMRFIIFPFGQHFTRPQDKLKHKIAQLLMATTPSRDRLSEGAFITKVSQNALADVQDALLKTIESEPIEKAIKQAKHDNLISGYTQLDQAQDAVAKGVISQADLATYLEAREARKKVIAVDDFLTKDLARIIIDEDVSLYENSSGTNG